VNSRQMWNLMRVVVALSLAVQSLVSFAAIPINAKSAAPIEAQQAELFVPSVSTLQPTPLATLLPTPVPTAAAFASPLPTPQPTLAPTPLPVTGTLSLTVTQALVDVRGARVTTADQHVQLDVPPGLFQRSTRLNITPRAAATNASVDLKMQFDLTAQDVASNTLISAFTQPVTLTVNLNGVIDRSQLKPTQHLALFYKTDNPDAPWSELLDAREVAPGIVQAPLAHFSTYAAGTSSNESLG